MYKLVSLWLDMQGWYSQNFLQTFPTIEIWTGAPYHISNQDILAYIL